MIYKQLAPGSWLYTDRMNHIRSDEIIAELRKQSAAGDQQDPILVVAVEEVPGKFAIISGNHRALIAERDQHPLPALVIESEEDLVPVEGIAEAWDEDSTPTDTQSRGSKYQRLREKVVQAALSIYCREHRNSSN